jgi:hypothetical protein
MTCKLCNDSGNFWWSYQGKLTFYKCTFEHPVDPSLKAPTLIRKTADPWLDRNWYGEESIKEVPQPSGDDLLNFQKRLDYQQTEIADLRNRINENKARNNNGGF